MKSSRVFEDGVFNPFYFKVEQTFAIAIAVTNLSIYFVSNYIYNQLVDRKIRCIFLI